MCIDNGIQPGAGDIIEDGLTDSHTNCYCDFTENITNVLIEFIL